MLVHLPWLVLLGVVAAPTAEFLWEKWTRNIWLSGHGLLMPFLVAWLAWGALRIERVKREPPSTWGFLFVLPGFSLVALDAAIRTELLAAFALLLTLPGFALLLLGRRRARALAFPCLLAFLMLPIPSSLMVPIHDVLRHISTHGGAFLLPYAGIPVFAHGTFLDLPHGQLHVVEACSGYMVLFAAGTIALMLAYMSTSRRRQALLLAAAAPLAVGSNILRVAALAALAEWYGYEILDTRFHVWTGYATFAFTLGPLLLLARVGAGKVRR